MCGPFLFVGVVAHYVEILSSPEEVGGDAVAEA